MGELLRYVLCVGDPMTDKNQHAFLTNMIMGEKAEITITLEVGGGVDIDGVRIFFDGFSLTATKISGVF